MDCYRILQLEVLSTSEFDAREVRLGQTLALIVGLTLVGLGRIIWLFCGGQ